MAAGRCFVPFPPNLRRVRLVRRQNRFAVEARWDGAGLSRETPAAADSLLLHLPNSGRMTELLQPGTLGLAHMERRDARATQGTLLLVEHEGRWVSVDARMPNRLFLGCLNERALAPFLGYAEWRAEVAWGRGRVDFLLAAQDEAAPAPRGSRRCLVETKSCNLVEQGVALFPDAPTARGARHLRELAEAVDLGYRAAMVWFVQRDDATAFAPHAKADPEFARALSEARAHGVEAYAYRCHVSPRGMTVLDEIPIIG